MTAIKPAVTLDEACTFLNKVAFADPYAMEQLVSSRVHFKLGTIEKVGGLQGIEVTQSGNTAELVGLLGVVNGMFGTDKNGGGAIAATYGEQDGEPVRLLGFSVIRRPQ